MNEFDKTIKYSELLRLYKALLTDTQQQIMSDYFEYDLSISEIAESRNVSRSAVEDAIKKSLVKLDDFEEKLSLLSKKNELKNKVATLKDKALNRSQIENLEEIERIF